MQVIQILIEENLGLAKSIKTLHLIQETFKNRIPL